MKGLIPEREGQAYRPDRVEGIKGRARARLLTRVWRRLQAAALTDQARLWKRSELPGAVPERHACKRPRSLLNACPRARFGKPRAVPEEVLVTAPVAIISDGRSEGRVAMVGPNDPRRNGVK